jgi:hypothetical protein
MVRKNGLPFASVKIKHYVCFYFIYLLKFFCVNSMLMTILKYDSYIFCLYFIVKIVHNQLNSIKNGLYWECSNYITNAHDFWF